MATDPSSSTPRGPLRWLVGGVLATASSLAVMTSCGLLQKTMATLLHGRQGDQIIFPLEPHQDLMDDCARCHEGVASHNVTAATRRALEQTCLECHGDQQESCSFCHTEADSAAAFPAGDRNLTFSHETHLQRTFGDCTPCHETAHQAGDGTSAAALPAHAECFACHQMQQFYDRLECQNCHEALFQYGLKPYDQFAHTVDFIPKEHAEFFRTQQSPAVCAQCHEQNFCSECHSEEKFMRLWDRVPEKVSRSFIHAGDYLYRHQWDERADPASCQRCHNRNFCKDCHDSQGISRRTAAGSGFTFHGPGVLQPGSADFHGDAARRDVLSCASCHAEGERGNCVTCHTVGSFGGNPHPPNFKSRLSRTGAPVCRLCHR